MELNQDMTRFTHAPQTFLSTGQAPCVGSTGANKIGSGVPVVSPGGGHGDSMPSVQPILCMIEHQHRLLCKQNTDHVEG